MPFAVYFANGALYVQKKLGMGLLLELMAAGAYRLLVLRTSFIFYVLNADSDR